MIWTLSFFASLLVYIVSGVSTPSKKFWGIVVLMGIVVLTFMVDLMSSSSLELGGQSLILLTLGLFFPTYLSLIQKIFSHQMSKLAPSLALLFMVLIILFFTENLLIFFILFELSAFPIIYLIFIGGSSKNKGEASLFLFVFTGLSAFLLFTFIALMVGCNGGDLSWGLSSFSPPSTSSEADGSLLMGFYIFLVISSFLVKMPVFFLHMWLPKAHVEAPVFGSMILASVMLKLGGYGVWMMGGLFWNTPFLLIFLSLGVYGALVAAMSCYGQKDVKVIIALSSVNHMTFILLGLVTLQSQSLSGALFLMLGHGVISSLMFFLSMKPYSNISSRSALNSILPGSPFLLSLSWIIIIFINSGFPPFLNFLGEVNILKQFLQNPTMLLLGGVNFLAVGLYGVLMLSLLSSSKAPKPSFSAPSMMSNHVVFLAVGLHFIILVVVTFFPSIWS